MAREIYYVRLTIRQMKFSRTKKFHTMFLEKPSVFLDSQREGTSFYFTYAWHQIQTFYQKKFIDLLND